MVPKEDFKRTNETSPKGWVSEFFAFCFELEARREQIEAMTEDRIHHHPPIRLDLTTEQCAAVDAVAPKGAAVLILGYAQRRRFPEHEHRTLCAWFTDYEQLENALVAAGIAAGRRKRPRKILKKLNNRTKATEP